MSNASLVRDSAALARLRGRVDLSAELAAMAKEIDREEADIYAEKLGRVMYEAYGSPPPTPTDDATRRALLDAGLAVQRQLDIDRRLWPPDLSQSLLRPEQLSLLCGNRIAWVAWGRHHEEAHIEIAPGVPPGWVVDRLDTCMRGLVPPDPATTYPDGDGAALSETAVMETVGVGE